MGEAGVGWVGEAGVGDAGAGEACTGEAGVLGVVVPMDTISQGRAVGVEGDSSGLAQAASTSVNPASRAVIGRAEDGIRIVRR